MSDTSRRLRGLAAALVLGAAAAPGLAQEEGSGPEITVVISEEPVDLDPGNTDYRDIAQITKLNVLEPLIFQDVRDASLKPRLATEWERVDDTTWRFTLREGVTFHDGTPFDADAVVASVDRLFSEDISSMNRAQFFGDNRLRAEKVDDLTVDLISETPDPILLTRIAQIMMTSPDTPADALVREPIGTGPYAFESWDAGIEIVLVPIRGLLGREAPGRGGHLRLALRADGRGADGRGRRGRHHHVDPRGSGHDRDGRGLSQLRHALLHRRRLGAAARRPARAPGAEPRHRPRGAAGHAAARGRTARGRALPAGDAGLSGGFRNPTPTTPNGLASCWPRRRPTGWTSMPRSS